MAYRRNAWAFGFVAKFLGYTHTELTLLISTGIFPKARADGTWSPVKVSAWYWGIHNNPKLAGRVGEAFRLSAQPNPDAVQIIN